MSPSEDPEMSVYREQIRNFDELICTQLPFHGHKTHSTAICADLP